MPTPLGPVPDFYGHSIFCDDIRAEADGKFTFVGVYPTQLMVIHTAFPITLPKLCIGVVFNQRHSLFMPDLTLRVVMPGDDEDRPSIEAELTGEVPAPERRTETDEYTMFGSNIVFSPFTIERSGRIKVRIVRDGTAYRLGSLRVAHISEISASTERSPQGEPASPSAPASS